MKTFIFVEEGRKFHKSSGASTIDLFIYKVEKNVPKMIDKIQYNTGSTRGEFSEVMNYLKQENYIKIPESEMYYYEEVSNKYNFQLFRV